MRALSAIAPRPGGGRVMWIDPRRVFYAGLIGTPGVRTIGAWNLYVSLREPLRLSLDGRGWRTGALALVPPYVPHHIGCEGRVLGNLLIEPETVDDRGLPEVFHQPAGIVDMLPVHQRILAAYGRLRDGIGPGPATGADFDECFLGEALAPRGLDPRIAGVVARIQSDPASPASAADCAASVNLSCSRFLHLFKQETGVAFRNFRAWKRARSLLRYVNRPLNLADVALDAGYPDSTHFSHSVRQVYGLTPRDIFAGSRRLVVVDRGGPPGLARAAA